ncbi:unnamed protein product [Nyctereutes procyonoides]|uniref:(raccoon dog) hypothetical protein n=1 Tax=Nyctereutes procyonoides TaxID=34880 RepID=A0A811ZQ46_NYCPR|nr:unnamed protein product [Nyctereutes procyonoides]
MHREPDVGFDPGSPGSRPGPKAGAKPLSRFTDSKCYEKDVQSYICNACVLLVKRWRKLPVDARAGPSLKTTLKSKKSNQSDDGLDTEMATGFNTMPIFLFLYLTYWNRQKIFLIDTHLFKPGCSNKQAAGEKSKEQGPVPLPISTQAGVETEV